MRFQSILFAIALCTFALNLEMPPMLFADDQKATEPGPRDADAPKEFTTTKTGLKYRILRKSKGEKPNLNQGVKVNYKGWLDDGKEFDSSYKAGRKPAGFALKRVIPGWTEGMQLIGEGGMIEFEIPYKLAYGEKGRDPIPPKATLHFIVELIEIVKPGPVDKDATEAFMTTKSGLKYRIRRKSDGPKPMETDTVQVHYKGWLDDGKVFDSSYDSGNPIEFQLNQVVRGWTEGLQLIGIGGMIELEIPSSLGYGAGGAPPVIPPNATLHFLVELLDVK